VELVDLPEDNDMYQKARGKKIDTGFHCVINFLSACINTFLTSLIYVNYDALGSLMQNERSGGAVSQ
jgi:hypothetical protein